MSNNHNPPAPKPERPYTGRWLYCANNCGDTLLLSPGDGKYCQNCLRSFERWAETDYW